jgi:preprotein translocase subunit SecA
VSSEALPRPGVIRGTRPERNDRAKGRLERALSWPIGALARRHEKDRLASVVRRVGEAGRSLADAGDEKIAEKVSGLRADLARQGLTDAHIISSFALVREVARRRLDTPHYDVQLMSGWIMSQGMLAEMATGEGKTLAATLPASAFALAGIPVHVISVNDYLVTRDARAMGPIYRALGLSVGTITDDERDPDARRAAYACDVTYCTSSQLAFDYLRDRVTARTKSGLAMSLERLHRTRPTEEAMMLRGLCCAIVDEADSILIDEARTPLILSGAGGGEDRSRIYKRALRLARSLDPDSDFTLEVDTRRLELSSQGRERLTKLAEPLDGFWQGPRRREEWVQRALSALHVFRCDHDYLVRDEKVQILDSVTGRIAADRSWEGGLHQLIELKEGCPLTPEREVQARISYQQFFRRYHRLAGMSGTTREVARELWSSYGLNSVEVPTRLPSQRLAGRTRVFASAETQWAAVIETLREKHAQGRPVLVGTCSLAASEELGRILVARSIPHQVLNARQDADEAHIVAAAGQAGRITVATSMAGRGTDIELGPDVAGRGGLHVIVTQLADARRIDRQLIGRSARQGDPGSFEILLSLSDEKIGAFFTPKLLDLMERIACRKDRFSSWAVYSLLSRPQRADERRHFRMRRALSRLEEDLDQLLAFAAAE